MLRRLSKTPPSGTPGRFSKSDQSIVVQPDRGWSLAHSWSGRPASNSLTTTSPVIPAADPGTVPVSVNGSWNPGSPNPSAAGTSNDPRSSTTGWAASVEVEAPGEVAVGTSADEETGASSTPHAAATRANIAPPIRLHRTKSSVASPDLTRRGSLATRPVCWSMPALTLAPRLVDPVADPQGKRSPCRPCP